MAEEKRKRTHQEIGRASRNKGGRAELALRDVFRSYGFAKAERTAQRRGKNGGEPDVVGIDNLHIECKWVEKLNLDNAMNQAITEAKKNTIPVVCHKKSRREWYATLQLDAFLKIWCELSPLQRRKIAEEMEFMRSR